MIIGKIVKPQGVKGEVKVLPLVSNDSDFLNFKKVFIDNTEYSITSCRVHEGFAYLGLSGVSSRNDAELLRDKEMEVKRDEMPSLGQNEYYIVDLIGCKLYNEKDEQLAKIIDIQNFGASDILMMRDGSEEVLCPLVQDLFVAVDLENKKIVVNEKRYKELTESED